MRTKRTFLNLLSEVLPQMIIAVISFIRVKVFLNFIGDEILGVYQLFGQILAYLSLAELGLTDAAMFYLYKPLYDKNKKEINSLISGIKKSFNYVMLAIIVLGVLVSPFVKFFMAENTLSNTFIITCFILTLLVNAFGYFQTTYAVLFNADQKKYKYSFWIQGLLILRNLTDILVIYLFKSLYAVLAVELSFTLLQNLTMKILFNKEYKDLSIKEKPTYVFWSKCKSLVPHKIGGLIAYNIDVILVSKFLGLAKVVVYNAYYAIIYIISGIVGRISSSALASIGNLLIAEPKRKYEVFLEFNDMLFFTASAICVPLSVCITPFIYLWYGAKYTVSEFTMYLFIFNLMYGIIRILLNVFTSAAALFKETLVCTYLEAVLNLTISIVLIKNGMGISGLLIGTAVSMLVSEFMIKPFILNKHLFQDKISKYYINCLELFTVIIINALVIRKLVSFLHFSNLLIWFVYGILIFIVNLLLTLLFFKLLNKLSFLDRIKIIFKKEAKSES